MDKLEMFNNYWVLKDDEKLKIVLDYFCGKEAYLYRYRPLSQPYDFEALYKNQFWIQCLGKQNDCDEGMVDFSFKDIKSMSSKQLKNSLNILRKSHNPKEKAEIEQNFKDIITQLNQQLKAIRDTVGIVCFSENKGDKRMWEKYADEGKGICLAYSIESLCKNNFLVVPVKYSERRLVDFFDVKDVKKNKFMVYSRRENPEIYYAIKDKQDWEVECEWRHFEKLQSTGNGEYYEKKIKPQIIYCGPNINDDDRIAVLNFCKSNDIDII